MGAVESRERVQNNNPANVSEQFLVNKVKREWYENDFVDGGSAASALNAAVDRNQSLMPETGWTYNAASGRPDNAFVGGVAGTAASCAGACTGYNGWCSETTHPCQRSCTTVLGIEFCGFNLETAVAPLHAPGSQQWRGESVVLQTHPMGASKRKQQGPLIQGGGEAEQAQVVDTRGGRMLTRAA